MKKNRTFSEWVDDRAMSIHTGRVKDSVDRATEAFKTVMTQLQAAENGGNASANELQRQAKVYTEASAICRAEADKAGRVSRRIQELLEA